MFLGTYIRCVFNQNLNTMKQLTTHSSFFPKALLMLGLFFFSLSAVQAQRVVSGAQLSLEKTSHDFGKVEQHSNTSFEFVFTNTGSEPLVLSNVKGSCSCTVPEWPRSPIMPGKSGKILVKYDSKRLGPFSRSVTISSNDPEQPSQIIRVKGAVEAASN